MRKVYCDAWTVGFDERFGSKTRLQQALMYYRPNVDNHQYAFPLDFTPLYDADKQEIVHIDVPKVRRPLSKAEPSDYHPKAIEAKGGYRTTLKPLNITQPEGPSFQIQGREISWEHWRFHIGFNYRYVPLRSPNGLAGNESLLIIFHREGIVLNNLRFEENGTEKPIFYRLSLAEMVVP